MAEGTNKWEDHSRQRKKKERHGRWTSSVCVYMRVCVWVCLCVCVCSRGVVYKAFGMQEH